MTYFHAASTICGLQDAPLAKMLFLAVTLIIAACSLPQRPEEEKDIVILVPNGGEYLTANTFVDLQWSSSANVSDVVSLFYSTDSAATWNYIGLDRNDGLFSWYVPNTPSTKCFIKISDYGDETLVGVSDRPFTISAQPVSGSLQIVYPNGGEVLTAGTIETVRWTSTLTESTIVALYYSINDGITWSLIGLDENDSSFLWYVPDYDSTECLIKIEDYTNPAAADVSDSAFTIAGGATAGSINIIYPNGGEILTSGNSEVIFWTSSGQVSSIVSLSYSTDNGDNWINIALDENDGSFLWYVPDMPSSRCLIQVSDYSDSTIFDISDDTFTIVGDTVSANFYLTYPNGGEIFEPETFETITWTSSGEVSTLVSLSYSTDSGYSWTEIGLDDNDGSYSWYVPDATSSTCLVKVQDYIDDTVFDVSDSVFTITGAAPSGTMVVVYPNGGETMVPGTAETLLWNYSGNVNDVVGIELSSDNGVNWSSVGLSENSGSYQWVVADITSTLCLIKISAYNDSSIHDESDGVFTIESSGTTVSDSIFYDALNSPGVNTSFVGFGIPSEMFARMKFTPTNSFELTHVRAYYRTEYSTQPVSLFVLSVSTGVLLQSVGFYGAEYQSNEGDFFLLSLNTPLSFSAGEEFYIVLGFQDVNYPVLTTGSGTNGHTGRSYYSDDGTYWDPLGDAIGDGGDDAWVIRALSVPESGTVATSTGRRHVTTSVETLVPANWVDRPLNKDE